MIFLNFNNQKKIFGKNLQNKNKIINNNKDSFMKLFKN